MKKKCYLIIILVIIAILLLCVFLLNKKIKKVSEIKQYSAYIEDEYTMSYEECLKYKEDTPSEYFKYKELEGGTIAITRYTGKDRYIKIPKSIDGKIVTTIDEECFAIGMGVQYTVVEDITGMRAIKGVILPNTIKNINDGAFTGQTLEFIHLNDGIEKIDQGAFWECRSLKVINLPSSLKEIGVGAFYKSGITSLEIPNSVKLESQIFSYSELEKVKLPNGIEELPYNFFKGTKIKEYTVPNTVKTIKSECFYNMGELEKLIIPDSVTKIDGGLTYSCPKLKEIIFEGKDCDIKTNVIFKATKEYDENPVKIKFKSGGTIEKTLIEFKNNLGDFSNRMQLISE